MPSEPDQTMGSGAASPTEPLKGSGSNDGSSSGSGMGGSL
jgi:hypothetical protein